MAQPQGVQQMASLNKEMPISKKAFSNAVLPCVGDVVGECRVMYVKNCDFKFQATGATLPPVGTVIEWQGKNYVVGYVDDFKRKYTASFSGFKDFTVPAPMEQDEEMVKLI